MSERVWSDYSKNIFQASCDLSRSLMIDAKAGSGKTTTLVELALRSGLGSKLIALAFNKSIATTLQQRLPGNVCSTLHSLGYGVLKNSVKISRRWEVDNMKYATIFRDSLKVKRLFPDDPSVEYQFNSLIHYMMVTMTDFTPSAMDAMADQYAVNIPCDLEQACELTLKAMAIGRQATFENGVVNFDEMLYWAAMEEWNVGTYHTVLVDEAQDLSRVQHKLISLINRNRLIACGDEFQAIYGFAGADNKSMDKLAVEFGLERMPLSICYRCSKNIVRHAQRVVPGIEFWDQSPEGLVNELSPNNLTDNLVDGCVILSRTNAPLVSLCFQLIKQGIRAKIKGKDVGDQLIAVCKLLTQMPSFDIDSFPALLDVWAEREMHKILTRGGKRTAILMGYINEKASCLMSFYDQVQPSSISEVIAAIKTLFTDDTIAGVTLMSGHKSKGLEFEKVFVIEPQRIPLVWNGQTDEQFKQEIHLDYVIRTRAQSSLNYVMDNGTCFTQGDE